MSRAKKIDHTHHHLKHPEKQPLIYDHIVSAMSDESKALLFTILVLSSLFLVFGLFGVFANYQKTSIVPEQDTRSEINNTIEKSPNFVPRT